MWFKRFGGVIKKFARVRMFSPPFYEPLDPQLKPNSIFKHTKDLADIQGVT